MRQSYEYFVSYSWTGGGRGGNGAIEVLAGRPVDSWSRLQEVTKIIEGNHPERDASICIANIILMSRPSILWTARSALLTMYEGLKSMGRRSASTALSALLAIALLTGCKDESPPRLVQVCVESYTTMEPRMIPSAVHVVGGINIGGGLHMVMTPVVHCTKHKTKCVWGRDFQGRKECKA